MYIENGKLRDCDVHTSKARFQQFPLACRVYLSGSLSNKRLAKKKSSCFCGPCSGDGQRQKNLLLFRSSGSPGSMVVPVISAGATPLTVIPFGPYIWESQCIRPWSADLDDLSYWSARYSSWNNVQVRIMRPDNTSSECRHTRAEYHSPPTLLLHRGQA